MTKHKKTTKIIGSTHSMGHQLTQPVLIAVASKHGSTLDVADHIARTLENSGIRTDVRKVEEVISVNEYQAVIVGSAVYGGSWLGPAKTFVDMFTVQLSNRPVWAFSSGPVGTPPKPPGSAAVDIDRILAQTQARSHRIFAGKLDKKGLNLVERALVLAIGVPYGDFRDWEDIENWAKEIAKQLKRGSP